MAKEIRIDDLNAPELDCYVRLTGSQLRASVECENGIFIAESPTVIEVALESGIEPISMLTDERLLHGEVTRLLDRLPSDMPMYISDKSTLARLTGFELTRGALCCMKRPDGRDIAELLSTAKRIAVLEEIADSTNIGAIFRSAAALGIDAVLLTPTCCDPLCRRAVRVSMGTVFKVPFAKIGSSHEDWKQNGIPYLKSMGFKVCSMALSDDSVGINDAELLCAEKIALVLGSEGMGLDKETIALSDYTVKIPMYNGVDSLNVAAAAAIAFYQIKL